MTPYRSIGGEQIELAILDSNQCPVPLRNGMIIRILALPFYSQGPASWIPAKISIIAAPDDSAIAIIDRKAIDFVRAQRDDDSLTSFLITNLSSYGRNNDTGSVTFGDDEEIITVTLNPEPCPETQRDNAFSEEIYARHAKAGRLIHAANIS